MYIWMGPGTINTLTLRIAIFVSLFFATSPIVNAQGGMLDNTFGDGGTIVINSLNASNTSVISILPDGKFILVSNIANYVLFTRCNENGTVDSSFGVNGVKSLSTGSLNSAGIGKLQTLPNGKMVIAGSGGQGFTLGRLNADYTFDPTFNGGNFAYTKVAAGHNTYTALAIQNDGKMVLAGGSFDDFALLRFKEDGTLDPSFNDSGKVFIEAGGYGGYAKAVIIQADGKIVAIGHRNLGTGTGDDAAMVRLKTNGEIDSAFGIYGWISTDIQHSYEDATAAIQLTDGSIIICGRTTDVNGGDYIIIKYKPNGQQDNTFGTGGVTTLDIDNQTQDISSAMVVQSDGKIIVAGYSKYNSLSKCSLIRLTQNGQLDTKFGTNGRTITGIGSLGSGITCMALDDRERIIVGGYAKTDPYPIYKIAIARYHSDETASVSTVEEESFTIVPNPASNSIKVKAASVAANTTYQLTDINGKLLLSGTFTQAEQQIDISSLIPATYFIQVIANNQLLTTQAIVKQ